MRIVSKVNNKNEKYLELGKNIFLWILLLFAGFILNDVYEVIRAESSLDIIMPSNYNERGEFEINLINNGDTDLEINKVKIQSCNMGEDEWVYRYPDNIPSGERITIYFFDNRTLSNFSLIDCRDNPLENWEEKRKMTIPLCEDKRTGELIVPNSNQTVSVCGTCYWNISIETPEEEFEFYEGMGAPVHLTQEIFYEDGLDINDPNLICTNSLNISIFGLRELEVMGYN